MTPFSVEFIDCMGVLGDQSRPTQVSETWNAVTRYFAGLGFTEVNYALFDPRQNASVEPMVRFYTTMDREWIEYYTDQRFDEVDATLKSVQTGATTPLFTGVHLSASFDRLTGEEQNVMRLAGEAGWKSAMVLPLTSSFDASRNGGGISIAGGMPEREFWSLVRRHGLEMMVLAETLHRRIGGPIAQQLFQLPALSPRERDSLSYIARGLRIDQIADKLGIARVTVEMHLRNARKRLQARTLPQAVATAMRLGQIRP
ncbi:MAG: autoinducer binding domain-containing protein [Rhodospirillales bacterium]|nr:autoinducer binding domain-containing protein [Rhodospirillales bacterium]